MCSTNPENWVTFEDNNPFQTPQKSQAFSNENLYFSKSRGLKLSLSPDQKNTSSSNPTTPHASPIIDFFMSPGPPSNSPLYTPVKDSPATPCTPKSASFNLYPIHEISRVQPYTLSEASSLLTANQTSNIPSPTSSGLSNLSPKQKSIHNLGNLTSSQQEPFKNDCSFSSPFWNNDIMAVSCCSEAQNAVDSHIKEKASARQELNASEKETFNSQKSLNQSSFGYVCERLQHLKVDPPDNLMHQPPCAERNRPSFIPQSLFRSQRKDGWPFMLRIPEKKNMMSSRQWGPIYLKVLSGGILQMYYEKGLEKPFREFQLHQFCRLSEPKLENLGVSEKIHSVKIENVNYVEKRKYHPKLEVIHEAEVEQMLKLGTMDYCDLMDFIVTVEEELMLLSPVSKQKRTHEEPEMSIEVVDNFWAEVTKDGKLRDKAVVCQLHCLSFINSDIECFLTLNDSELQRLAKTYFENENDTKFINISEYEFHKCVKRNEFIKSRIIKFTPVDGCRFELMRFKAPCDLEELPFTLKSSAVVQGAYVELQAFLNMSGSASPSLQTKYCENITIHFPVPDQWVRALWTASLQRQRSIKTKMNRRACLGSTYEIESEPVIQVTIGTAKYEYAYKAVVWKIDRLPDKNSCPDQPHNLSCRLELGSDQEIPRSWSPVATVQYVMPSTCVSGVEVKSMGIESDIQPNKHVWHKACCNIQVEIERKYIPTDGEDIDKAGECIAHSEDLLTPDAARTIQERGSLRGSPSSHGAKGPSPQISPLRFIGAPSSICISQISPVTSSICVLRWAPVISNLWPVHNPVGAHECLGGVVGALAESQGVCITPYLDNLLIMTPSLPEVLQDIRTVLSMLELFRWIINYPKSQVVPSRVATYLEKEKKKGVQGKAKKLKENQREWEVSVMAHAGNPNPVPKLYKSIIDDVIDGVSELFAEEGVDEQVLTELKRLWETKVMQSKATEGFFRDHCSMPQFVLQLPQHLHQSLHASAVLQGSRNITNFTGTDGSSSTSGGSFTLPHGITYPIHLPAGMTVQTASGQLYKVTVPVMVTQAPGAPRILQQPVQQYFQHISQPPRAPTSTQPGGNVQSGQKWQQQQQVPQVSRFPEVINTCEAENPLENNLENANGEPFIQQTVDMQRQQLASNVLNQPLNGLKENNCNDMPPPLFSPKQAELTLADNSESFLNNLNTSQTVQGQAENECTSLLKSQVADNVCELILLDDEDGHANKDLPLDNNNNPSIEDKVSVGDSPLSLGDLDIIQLDGAGDTSSDEELGAVREVDENEFLGIIDTEDLKALEEEDSGSNDLTSNSSDDEDPDIDIIEEDPLNSGDDVSEQEVPDLFDTDNVIVCQYDKIHRSKNKWKFYLKDGVMCFGGKDYIFSKAIGEAEW
ncbi:stonin-1-like [Gastrophryne carolinensis]